MKKIAVLGLCAAVLAAAQASAAVLYDSGGFSGYSVGDLAGQDGWSGGVAPDGAAIGAGIGDFGGGNTAYLIHNDPTLGAYGVWTHSLAPTADPIISVNWWQYVDGGAFGVMLYNGATAVAEIDASADAVWHQWKMNVDLSANQVTVFMDSAFFDSWAISGSSSVDSVGLLARTGIGNAYIDDLSVVSSVPEPTSSAMGLASAALFLRRRRAAK